MISIEVVVRADGAFVARCSECGWLPFERPNFTLAGQKADEHGRLVHQFVGRAYTCPRCGRTSWHPEDARHGYCGACHEFTGAPA